MKLWRWSPLVLLVLTAVAAAVAIPSLARQARVGTAYVAKDVCSCVYVGRRSLSSCLADLPSVMGPVRAELLEGEEGVRAWVSLLGERTAHYRVPRGCTLD